VSEVKYQEVVSSSEQCWWVSGEWGEVPNSVDESGGVPTIISSRESVMKSSSNYFLRLQKFILLIRIGNIGPSWEHVEISLVGTEARVDDSCQWSSVSEWGEVPKSQW